MAFNWIVDGWLELFDRSVERCFIHTKLISIRYGLVLGYGGNVFDTASPDTNRLTGRSRFIIGINVTAVHIHLLYTKLWLVSKMHLYSLWF